MTEPRIIAVDPGGTTGLAFHGFEYPPLEREQTDHLEMLSGLYELLGEHIVKDIPVTIVCEKFFITGQTSKKSRQTEALRIIGALEWMCDYSGAHFVLQPPSDAKDFASNDRIRAAGLWHVGGAGHANDAARHLLLYMVKHRMVDIAEIDARAAR